MLKADCLIKNEYLDQYDKEIEYYENTHSYCNESEDIIKYNNSTHRTTKATNELSSVESSECKKRSGSRHEAQDKDTEQKRTSPNLKFSPNHLDYQTFGKPSKTTKQSINNKQQIDDKKKEQSNENIKFGTEFVETTKNSETPILFLDVNFGKGHITRIVMYENDTPEELAEAFCIEHKLDDEKKSKLISIIKKHLDKVLEKIVEQPYDEE